MQPAIASAESDSSRVSCKSTNSTHDDSRRVALGVLHSLTLRTTAHNDVAMLSELTSSISWRLTVGSSVKKRSIRSVLEMNSCSSTSPT